MMRVHVCFSTGIVRWLVTCVTICLARNSWLAMYRVRQWLRKDWGYRLKEGPVPSSSPTATSPLSLCSNSYVSHTTPTSRIHSLSTLDARVAVCLVLSPACQAITRGVYRALCLNCSGTCLNPALLEDSCLGCSCAVGLANALATLCCSATQCTLTPSCVPQGWVKSTSYTWNFGDGIVISGAGLESMATQTHSYSTTGRYTVSVLASNPSGSSSINLMIFIGGEVLGVLY